MAVTCLTGYFASQGVCVSCSSTNTACNSQCTSLGYFTSITNTTGNSTTSCIGCGPNALSCTNVLIAITCAPSYYLNSQSTCIACLQNAQTCQIQPTLTYCLPGYVLSGTSCLPCPANFFNCTTQTNGSVCMTGYYLSTPYTTCTACPSPASQCTSATVF